MSTTITFNELIAKYAESEGCSKNAAKGTIRKVFEVISSEVNNGNGVAIPDFGKFELKTREARKGRNPRTGEEIEIPETTSISFKPSKSLKSSLN